MNHDPPHDHDQHARRLFAAAALQGMLAARQEHDDEEALALAAWSYADRMLESETSAPTFAADELAARIERATEAAAAVLTRNAKRT